MTTYGSAMARTGTERIVIEGLGRLPQFSHAGRAGDALHVSGTLGTIEGLTLASGIGAQTTQVLGNIGRILAAGGAGWRDVAKVDVYLHDMADFAAMNEAYATFFADLEAGSGTDAGPADEVIPPARITVGGVDLALGALVEMDCIAAVSTGASTPERPAPGWSTPLPSRRNGHVDHDGESLYFEVLGAGGTPLVLSHGAGGNHAIWFQQVAHFALDRTVVVWDHRGYGRSTDHAGRSGPDVATGDLLAVLDHLGIERADLVGQSMGGWTSVGAVLERPSLARSLVLADTLAGFATPGIEAAAAGAHRPEIPADAAEHLGLHPAIDPSLARRDPARAHLYQQLAETTSVDVPTLIGRLLATRRTADDAGRITCPVLCVVGDLDPLFPPAAVRALTDLLPDGRVVEIPGSGHSPYFEDPELWNLVVGRFLEQVVG